MAFNRRQLLAGASAAAMLPLATQAEAWPFRGSAAPTSVWSTILLGGGGLVTGVSSSDDGHMLMRSDVGNIYRWTTTQAGITDPQAHWEPLFTKASVAPVTSTPVNGGSLGAFDLVCAPSDKNRLYSIGPDFTSTAFNQRVYYSTDQGTTWNIATINSVSSFLYDCDSNSTFRYILNKLVVDPNNPNVCYLGLPYSPTGNATHGITSSCYRTINGVDFTTLTTDGSTPFPAPVVQPGCTCILFDRNYTGGSGGPTIVVGGQTRTKRIIIPVAGIDVFESVDGGQTFTSTGFATKFAADWPTLGTNFSVGVTTMDYDGVLYAYVCTVTNNGNGATSAVDHGQIYRYSGAGGIWVQLTQASLGWPAAASFLTGFTWPIMADPRPGHQGYLTVGIFNGYTSANANASLGSSSPALTWAGPAGTLSFVHVNGPSYDAPWFSDYDNGGGGPNFLATIDINGYCIGTGGRGVWCCSQSDFATPAIPLFTASSTTWLNYWISFVRGSECTVAECATFPPGGAGPIIAVQDCAIHECTPNAYPTHFWPGVSTAVTQRRAHSESVDWAAFEPNCVVARVNEASGVIDYSAYNLNYGLPGSWVQYPNSSMSVYGASFTGGISDGAGGSGTILNVSAVASGLLMPTTTVTIGGVAKGIISSQLTGPTGGVGTYRMDTASLTASGSGTSAALAANCGQVVAIDRDHVLMIPSGFATKTIPIVAIDATTTCTWKACQGLPILSYTNRSWVNGYTARPADVDGQERGTVYIVALGYPGPAGVSTVFRSTDSGQNFVSIGTITMGASYHSPYLFTDRNKAGHVWIATAYTGGSTQLYFSFNANDPTPGNVTWTQLLTLPPAPYGVPKYFGLGAPQTVGGNATLYLAGWNGFNTEDRLFYSVDDGANWILFPKPDRYDLPPITQLGTDGAIGSIHPDWTVFKKVYGCGRGTGAVVFNP